MQVLWGALLFSFVNFRLIGPKGTLSGGVQQPLLQWATGGKTAVPCLGIRHRDRTSLLPASLSSKVGVSGAVAPLPCFTCTPDLWESGKPTGLMRQCAWKELSLSLENLWGFSPCPRLTAPGSHHPRRNYGLHRIWKPGRPPQ